MFKNIFLFKTIFFLLIVFLFIFFIAEIIAGNELLSENEPQCLLKADRLLISPGDTFQLTISAGHPFQNIKEVLYYDPRGWQPNYYCAGQKCTRSWWVDNDTIGTFEYKGGFYTANNEWIECSNVIIIEVAEASPKDDREPEEDIKSQCVLKTEPSIIEKGEFFNLKMEASHPDGIKYAEFAEKPDEYIGRTNCHNNKECSVDWFLQENKSGSYQYWAGFLTSRNEWFECQPANVDVKDNFNILVQSSIDGKLEEGVKITYALGLQSRLTHFLLSSWHPGIQVFRAPETYQGYEFSHWSDCTLAPGAEGSPFQGLPISRDCLVTVSWWPFKSNKTVVAHYKSIEPQCSWGISPENPVPKTKFSLYLTLKHPHTIEYAQYKLEGSDVWSDKLNCNNQYICRLSEHLPAHDEAGAYKYFVRFKTAKNEWFECDAIIVNVEERENEFLLSVEITGNGSGYVFADPYEVYYSYDFYEKYKENTLVTLTAEANENSVFLGWQGDCSGQGSCIVEMTKDKSVKAVFEEMSTEEDKHFLTVEIDGQGKVSVDPSGISPYIGPDAYLYHKNETVTLTALPDDDAEFIEWTGDCSGENKKCILKMTDDKIVGAIFGGTMDEYFLGLYVDGPGTVRVEPAGIDDFDGPHIYMFKKGTEVTLTPIADEGIEFAGWKGDCSEEDETCFLTMTDHKSVEAFFGDMYSCTKIYGDGPSGIELVAVPLDNKDRLPFAISNRYSFEDLKSECHTALFTSEKIENEDQVWIDVTETLASVLDYFPPFNPEDFTIYRSNNPFRPVCWREGDISEIVYILDCPDLALAFAYLGGNTSVLSLHPLALRPGALAHELGHSFAELCDEYIRENREPNLYCLGCAKDKCPTDWQECFEGCNYQKKEWYRDSENSVMNMCYDIGCQFGPTAYQIIEETIDSCFPFCDWP